MAKQAGRAMFVVRDEKDTSEEEGAYMAFPEKPTEILDGEWLGGDATQIDPDQSPVALAPGGGPVEVWLTSEEPE